MANYSALKAAVQAVVKTNGNQEITGANMQATLLSIIDSLGNGYQLMGVATPSTTPPSSPDYNIAYIAGAGSYTNFGTSVVIPPTNIAIFKYNGSWACEQVTVENGGVFDISAYNNNTTYADLAAALGTNGANVPESVRKGGMSVKFVQSSDNKYVQYRLMADEFSTTESDWSFCGNSVYINSQEFIYVKTDSEDKILWAIKTDGSIYWGAGIPQQVKDYVTAKIAELSLDEYEDIVAFLGNLITGSKTLQELLNEKVDEEEGKSLIDEEVADNISYIYHDNLIDAKTDSNGKLLEGIDLDGSKILGNVKINGFISAGSNSKETNWKSATIDDDNKVIEGINENWEKFISKFSTETESMIINDICTCKYIIPILNSSFVSPLKYKVYSGSVEDESVKGLPTAKYVFNLPLSQDAFNVRFKFLIKDNIINSQETVRIADLDGLSIVAQGVSLSQQTTTYTLNGLTKTSYLPSFNGGISLNGSVTNSILYNTNVGRLLFSIQYIGNSSNVTLENDGTKFILSIDGSATEYDFSTYSTLSELYEILSQRSDLSLGFNSIENVSSQDIAVFGETHLVSNFYTRTNGSNTGDAEEYEDNPIFYIPSGIDDSWHQVEIVRVGGKVYASVDGIVKASEYCDGGRLSLGGDCSVLFKDMEIYTNSPYDAEIVNGEIISSANPSIVIFEGHQMIDSPTDDISSTSFGVSVDRLSYIFDYAIKKGYVPVPLSDIASYYNGKKDLSKRCFTIIMDDYEYPNCLNENFRRVFVKYGIYANLAIVTGKEDAIYHNGVEITKDKAAAICNRYNFQLLSHTRNHRDVTSIKPSLEQSEFTSDVYSADDALACANYVVYPYGRDNMYVNNVISWLGYSLGIGVDAGSIRRLNRKITNKYHLMRKDIGIRTDLSYIINSLL